MGNSLNIAATGMAAQQTNVEVISNNIANMNTTAYTRRRPEFADLLYQNLRRVGSQSSDTGTIVPTGVQLGSGVKTTAVYRITEQGSVTSTDNGRLTLNLMARNAPAANCTGLLPGISPANNPAATPPATLLRCRCHRL